MKNCSIVILYLYLASISAVSQSQQQEPPPGTDAAPPAQQRSDDTTEPSEVPQRAAPATQFTPTEKIRADDAVAFPVDI